MFSRVFTTETQRHRGFRDWDGAAVTACATEEAERRAYAAPGVARCSQTLADLPCYAVANAAATNSRTSAAGERSTHVNIGVSRRVYELARV